MNHGNIVQGIHPENPDETLGIYREESIDI